MQVVKNLTIGPNNNIYQLSKVSWFRADK